MNIIIRGKSKIGKVRSEQEENLRKEWGSTITDEQLDRIKHLEKKAKDKFGTDPNFVSAIDADHLK
jgi:hypothetical protein